MTPGQASVSADPQLDRREEYFHSFTKAFLKAPWGDKKERGDSELSLSTLRCEKCHLGLFSQIRSWIPAHLGDGKFQRCPGILQGEKLFGSWTPGHQNVGVRDFTEVRCHCLVTKVHENITSCPSWALQVSLSFIFFLWG